MSKLTRCKFWCTAPVVQVLGIVEGQCRKLVGLLPSHFELAQVHLER